MSDIDRLLAQLRETLEAAPTDSDWTVKVHIFHRPTVPTTSHEFSSISTDNGGVDSNPESGSADAGASGRTGEEGVDGRDECPNCVFHH